MSELVETYGFSFINVEKLLLDHLLKKVPENERVGASFDAQSIIKVLILLFWGCQLQITALVVVVPVKDRNGVGIA